MFYLILILICSLELGLLGRLSLSSSFVPNLLVVFLWAMTWLKTRQESLPLAIFGGLLLDMAGFSYFGIWTVISVSIVLLTHLLKYRSLDTSSVLHAILALALASLIAPLMIGILVHKFDFQRTVYGVGANVVVGGVVYYLLAMRLKLFSRWAGRRIDA
ncbi:MAG: hypothetical protein AAB774_01245 [Patescibacteria group bacterium]